MKLSKRILATLSIILLTLFFSYMSLEAASTSSGHSVDERRSALISGFMALALGCLSIIAVWVPWQKLMNKKS